MGLADGDQYMSDLPFISLNLVTLRLRDKLVFKETSWKIKGDEQWAIMGPNGSGKSTLANALFRSIPIYKGHISYFFQSDSRKMPTPRSYFEQGEIIKISPDSHRQLIRGKGYHQSRWNSIANLNQPLVSEILSGRRIEKMTRFHVGPTRTDESVYQKRRDDALQLLEIGHLLDRKVTHLSNGETRKVLLARALMQAPKLLILDDVFAGLDNQTRQTLKTAIESLFNMGNIRILLITARQDEIPQAITHIVRVKDCEIEVLGPRGVVLSSGSHQSLPRRKRPRRERGKSTKRFSIEKAEQQIEKSEKKSQLVGFRNVNVIYGDVRVLKNVSWQMKTGENWAIFGRNGAGKTTLLSLILADNPQAYSNQVQLFGKKRGSGESIWEIKQKIGWVSPELHVFYHRSMSCLNVVRSGFFDSVGLYKTCTDEQTQTAVKWMKATGIEGLVSRSFGSLSVGEQRLVLICRALVKDPALLILDEPCQGLDVKNRSLILQLLDEICKKTSVNMIFVTHHFDEIPDAITHIMMLDNGQIQSITSR